MAHADAAALARLLPLLRQLREIKGLRETQPGTFHLKGSAFIHFHDEAGALFGDLKRARGGFDRYPVDTPVGQRKLLDDAKRRVDRGDDE
ncbi:MAG TPA: hypothetical protein VIP10_07325 [Burkholderiaceae bacterium]